MAPGCSKIKTPESPPCVPQLQDPAPRLAQASPESPSLARWGRAVREMCQQIRWHRRVQPLFRDCRLEARPSLPPTPSQAERARPRAWMRSTISLFSRPKTQAGGRGTPLKEQEVGMGREDLSSPLGDTPCPGPARRGRLDRPNGPKLRVASPARFRLPGTPRDRTPACVSSRTIIPNPHPTHLALGRCSRGAVPGAGWAHDGSTAGAGSAAARLLPLQTRKAAEAAPPPDLAMSPRPPRASRPHSRSDAGPARPLTASSGTGC